MEHWGAFGAYVSGGYSLQEGLARTVAAQRYHTSHDDLAFAISGQEFAFIHRSALKNAAGYAHFAPAAVLAILDVFKSYLGPQWAPSRIEFDIPAPRVVSAFEETFRTSVVFDRRELRIVAPVEELLSHSLSRESRRPISLSDVRRSMLAEAPKDVPSVVRELVRASLHNVEVPTTLESVAEKIGLGPRTLQRRLGAENLSFRELLNDVRTERATELLSETGAPIVDIAVELGYSSATHFTRAFRRATGRLPSRIRKEATAVP